MPINEKLSFWDAWNTCFCGRWHWQPSPARSPEGICYQRDNADAPALSAVIRTWRDLGGGKWEHVGPDACEVCGYDLTQTPEANLRAVPAEEWGKGEIVGSAFGRAGEPLEFVPDGVDIVFARCDLDNVALPARATMIGKSKHWQGVVCSHNRVALQTDGRDWICRWKASGDKAADSPVQPTDYATALIEGRNVDPTKLPAEPLSKAEADAEQQAYDRWVARVENARVYVAQDGWVACECIAARKAIVDTALGKAVPADKIMPDRACKLCGGCGALPPVKVVSIDGVSG
jgi:hypothetical protein